MATALRLIVGLGNPGSEYAETRHNAGAQFVEAVARQHAVSLAPETKFFGSTARVTIKGRDLRLLVPSTYMNRSGQAVQALAAFFKIEPEEILVAHDELDLPTGAARWKRGGGHGGHNGLRDIMAKLGNNGDFCRLRLGIGHPGKGRDVTGYVLGRAPSAERELLEQAIDAALDTLPLVVTGDLQKAMTRLHTNNDS